MSASTQSTSEPRLCECGADLDRLQDHNLDCRSRLSGFVHSSPAEREKVGQRVATAVDEATLIHAYAGWPGKTQCEASGNPVSSIRRSDVTCPRCLEMTP